MILIIGGAYQGKLSYAKAAFSSVPGGDFYLHRDGNRLFQTLY